MEKVQIFQKNNQRNFTTAYYHYNDRDTLIEQSSVIKYSNKAVTNVSEIGIM